MVKIFETDRADVSKNVAIATNSQARINSRDLHSNDDIQKKIEVIFSSKGLFYERKKNQYAEKPYELRVDALKLGQIILSYDLEEPDKAKTDSDNIFGGRYKTIFNDSLDANKLFRLVNIFREIEKRRDGARALQRSLTSAPELDKFLSYGQWYMLYTIKQLCRKDGIYMPAEQNVERYVDEAQRIVTQVAGDYKTWAYYDMFRSPKFREKIDMKYFSRQLELF